MSSEMFRCAAASVMFVVSMSCEIAEAADPGFYVGAAGGRSEQRLDKQAGVGPMPTVIAQLGGGFFPVDPAPGRLPVIPPYLPPPAFGVPISPPYAVFLPTRLAADETDVGWNFSLGYRVNKYLAAELAYVDSGEASLVEHYGPVASLSPTPIVTASEITRGYSVTSRGPALSVLGSWPLSAQWELFVRGGVLFAKQEVEMRTRSTSGIVVGGQLDRDFSDEVVTVGAGVQWAFTARWTARLEYQRTDDLQANEIMGKSRIDQASLSVLFGL